MLDDWLHQAEPGARSRALPGMHTDPGSENMPAGDRGSSKNWFVSQARRAEAFLITWLEFSGLLEPALAAAGREHPR